MPLRPAGIQNVLSEFNKIKNGKLYIFSVDNTNNDLYNIIIIYYKNIKLKLMFL